MKKPRRLLALTLSALCYLPISSLAQDSLFIVPKPVYQQQKTGYFTYPNEIEVFASKTFLEAAELLHEHPYINFKKVKNLGNGKHAAKKGISLVLANEKDTLSQDGYRLEVENERIVITAHQPAALLTGIATLRQLAYTRKNGRQIPAVYIEDKPEFSYRGLHLDVSRHFFPVSFVKKYIDLMSLYKLNTFHWHLIDGAGWRIEIKKYPELTQQAAWRVGNTYKAWRDSGRNFTEMGAPDASGGFYTQEEAADVVKYAAKRGITVIPEIEMPGHSEEVFAVYPWLSCYGVPHKNGEFCIGNEQTFEFLQNVLDEVIAIFPSKLIHIGGDEANKNAWKKCPKCQKLIADKDLKDEHGLQSYAVKRMETYLNSKGRKLIGWDEIMEGGLAPSATVMSWRGEKGGIEAANAGHDVVMTPERFLYFDAYQTNPVGQPEAIGGYSPIKKIYGYHPVPADIKPENKKHVLGLQANVWTEYMPTQNQVEYMVYPRALALAEVGWTPQDKKSWPDFQTRLQHQYLLFQRFNVNYYQPSNELSILSKYDMNAKVAKVSISSEHYQPNIHYTLDGTTPTAASPRYQDTLILAGSAPIKAALFKDQDMRGKVHEYQLDVHKAIGKKVIYNNQWSPTYPAKGEGTMTNGETGDLTYGDGQWQGFLSDFDVVIDMESKTPVEQLKIRFMQLTGPDVYIPAYATVSVSDDGQTFTDLRRVDNDVPTTDASLRFKTFVFDLKGLSPRYIRVIGKNERKSYMFADEIIVY